MKTIILDKNKYPFEITPEAITTNFALFRKSIEARSQMTLVLFGDSASADNVINEHESDNRAEECIAKGYYSYAGTQPKLNKWVSEMKNVGSEFSQTELAALRSDIWTEVNKIFKAEISDGQVTSERRMSDIVDNLDNEPTHVAYTPCPGKNAEQKIVIQSLHSRPIPPQAIDSQKQPSFVM